MAACFLIFCWVPASFTAFDFSAFCSAFFASPFACAFAVSIVNSFAASSDSSLRLRKVFGTVNVPRLLLAWISPS